MKKLNYLLLSSLFLGTFMLSSCGGDDGLEPIDISVTGVPTITIDENPASNATLATLKGAVNRGDIAFSLSDQNPAGAMVINATTGELTVADASLFDFETNPTLTAKGNATVEGITESATITVKLNNVAETVTAPDATFTIAENPADGAEIGTLMGTTDAGTITYDFPPNSINPAGIAISTTGIVTVTDPSQFDFESNETIAFNYQASNGADMKTGSVTINITDVDERPVQERLHTGEKPSAIVASGVTVDSLYGKNYGSVKFSGD